MPRDRIGIPEQLEPRRTREFNSAARPTLVYNYRDTADAPISFASGVEFRASLHLTAGAVATYEVTPTITNPATGEITIATVSGATAGRQQVFRIRRWDAGDDPNTDAPRGVYEERWDIPV